MRKSRQSQAARPSERSSSKSAPSRDSVGRRSKRSNVNVKTMRVATPKSRRLRLLRDLELIVPVGLPADERSVHLDLTEEGSTYVGYIHSEFNARLAYVLTNIGAIESHLVELRREAKILRARYSVSHLDEKKTDRDAAATLDPEIKEVEDKMAEEDAKLKMLQGVADGYVKIIEGASREITRRENERASQGD